MAVTQFVFCAINTDLPAVYTAGAVAEDATPAGSSTATTAAATNSHNKCRVTTDTDVYVSFGAAPDAGTDTARFLMIAGTTEYFDVATGDKGAVIEA